jgi:hypothetical protein
VPDNLTIQFGADTSKLDAAVENIKLQIRSLSREAKKAFDRGDTAAVNDYTNQIGRLRSNMRGLNQTIAETGAVTAATSRQIGLSARSFRSLDQAVGGLARSLAGARAGLVALAAVKGINAIGDAIKSAVDQLEKIKDLSSEIGRKPIATQATQELGKEAGLSDADVTKFQQARSDAITKLMTATGPQDVFSRVREMRGRGPGEAGAAEEAAGHMQNVQAFTERTVQTFRGGVPVIRDFSDALKEIGINVDAFMRLKPEERLRVFDQALISYNKNAARAGRSIEQLNFVSQALTNLPMDKALKITTAELDGLARKTKELENSQRGATDANIQKAEEQRQADVKLEQAKQEAAAATLLSLGETNKAATEAQAAALQAAADYAKGLRGVQLAGDEISKTNAADQIMTDWSQLPQFFDSLTQQISNSFAALWSTIQAGAQSVANTLSNATPGLIPPIMGPQFAAGGIVNGPGTGTSDSIMARLSDGEFVMRAAAVRTWGPDFMAALNAMRNPFAGFAAGGLVGHGFADGGLVAGPGGVPVHLHLGGHSFALSGSGNVVDSLVVEARRQQVRSAGVKPSWFAGRPGG